MQVACPHCLVPIEVTRDVAGRDALCPRCNQIMALPALPPPQRPPPIAAARPFTPDAPLERRQEREQLYRDANTTTFDRIIGTVIKSFLVMMLIAMFVGGLNSLSEGIDNLGKPGANPGSAIVGGLICVVIPLIVVAKQFVKG